MAQEHRFRKRINRRTKFAVVSVDQLRAVNPRDDSEVVEAAGAVTKEMISALEEMVNAAKAGRLEGEDALALAAAAWPAERLA